MNFYQCKNNTKSHSQISIKNFFSDIYSLKRNPDLFQYNVDYEFRIECKSMPEKQLSKKSPSINAQLLLPS